MREMAAQEVRRGLLNKMPMSLRNCVNKDLLTNSHQINNTNSNGGSISNSNGINSILSTNNNNLNLNNINNNSNSLNNNGMSNSNNNRSGNSPANLIAASVGNPMSAASLLSATSNLNSSNPNAQLLAQLNCKHL